MKGFQATVKHTSKFQHTQTLKLFKIFTISCLFASLSLCIFLSVSVGPGRIEINYNWLRIKSWSYVTCNIFICTHVYLVSMTMSWSIFSKVKYYVVNLYLHANVRNRHDWNGFFFYRRVQKAENRSLAQKFLKAKVLIIVFTTTFLYQCFHFSFSLNKIVRSLLGFFSRKQQIAYLLLIRPFWMIKLFMNRRQIRFLNSKTTDLDWYHSRYYQKLK